MIVPTSPRPARSPGRVTRSVVFAAVAALGLSACISTPSAKRVALDVVDSLATEGVPESVRECMRDRIDEYSKDELQDIAAAADAGNPEGVAGLATLEQDLAACSN